MKQLESRIINFNISTKMNGKTLPKNNKPIKLDGKEHKLEHHIKTIEVQLLKISLMSSTTNIVTQCL